MGIIPLDVDLGGRHGAGFRAALHGSPRLPDRRPDLLQGHAGRRPDDLIVPRWAFFCRAVIDAGELPLTAAREGLQESRALQFARKRIGFRLLSELILVHGMYPDVFHEIIALHAEGLKALAVHESDVRDLLRSTLPYGTTHGERTIQQLIEAPARSLRPDADTYHALCDVAAHAGVLLVDASGAARGGAAAARRRRHPGALPRGHRARRDRAGRPRAPRRPAAAALVAKAGRALHDERVSVQVASFEPADRPVLWWPAGEHSSDDARGVLVLNAACTAVKRLLDTPEEADIGAPLHALYVTALLLGRVLPTDAHAALLRTAVADMIEAPPT